MHLSPSQLSCKGTSQIVPDHAAFDRQTKRYPCSVARFLETASERAGAHACLFVVKTFPVVRLSITFCKAACTGFLKGQGLSK